MTTRVHPRYATQAAAEAAAAFPAAVLSPWPFVPYSTSNAAIVEESFTVPAASPYQVQGPIVLPQSSLTITVGAVARTVVRGSTPASGQVGYDPTTGVLTFHSGDAAGAGKWSGTPLWSRPDQSWIHWIQGELKAIETELLAGGISRLVSALFFGIQEAQTGSGLEVRIPVPAGYKCVGLTVIHADKSTATGTTTVRASDKVVGGSTPTYIDATVASSSCAGSEGTTVAGANATLAFSVAGTLYVFVQSAGNHQNVQVMVRLMRGA